MQVKKEAVRQRLLEAAEAEFREKGFDGASLRGIATRADVTKGALYPYFPNKAALFQALTDPARETVAAMFDRTEDAALLPLRDTPDQQEREARVRKSFRRFARAVLEKRGAFYLLLLCNNGEAYRQYKESIILAYEEKFPQILPWFVPPGKRDVQVSQIFLHTVAALFFHYIEELVLHAASPEEGDAYAGEMAAFVLAGANALANGDAGG